jgi:hypothetical protein
MIDRNQAIHKKVIDRNQVIDQTFSQISHKAKRCPKCSKRKANYRLIAQSNRAVVYVGTLYINILQAEV